jgi:very-short-patch-repair endonuclease
MRGPHELGWREVARSQEGLIARRQLRRLGQDKEFVRTQLRAGRWQEVSAVVLATTTGALTRDQLMWAGVLHAGPGSAVGTLTALERHGLRNWHRDPVTIMVEKSHDLEPLPGVDFVQTRRDIAGYRADGRLPVWQVEPAALLFAAYEPVTRTAYGLLSAVVQQRLSTPARLEAWIGRMRPLRRARSFRRVLDEMAGGAQSMAELDVGRMCRRHGLPRPTRQVRRRDSAGRFRYTDAEWRLPGGRVVVLEVDGGFHMEVEHWADDIERERSLVATGAVVLRCTAQQLRDDDLQVARDLRRVGVGASSA